MSLAAGFPWSYQDFQFVGYSLAGITTSMLWKNTGICFDLGQGLPFQNSARYLLITHGHLDHAAGLPYVIAQKNMAGQKETKIFVPSGLADPLTQIIRLWESIDHHSYSYELRAAQPGELYELGPQLVMKPFATTHRVQSQGYLIYQKRKRLKAEFRECSQDEILQVKRRGEDPNEHFLEPAVAFTGDTQIEFVDADPDVGRAKVLFVEVTFWGDEKPVAHARKWGHLHFDELLAVLPRLANERIVLIHASVRYSSSYLQAALAARLSAADRERVVLFPRPL